MYVSTTKDHNFSFHKAYMNSDHMHTVLQHRTFGRQNFFISQIGNNSVNFYNTWTSCHNEPPARVISGRAAPNSFWCSEKNLATLTFQPKWDFKGIHIRAYVGDKGKCKMITTKAKVLIFSPD